MTNKIPDIGITYTHVGTTTVTIPAKKKKPTKKK